MNSSIKLNNTKSLIVSAFIISFVLILKFSFFREVRVEDYQEVVFPVFLILFFLIQKEMKVGVSRNTFLLLGIVWLGIQARVFVMRELGFYEGRVVIGKLSDDTEGYGARSIARGIKVIGRTYSLSGPSLVPFQLGEREVGRWFATRMRPSLIISGSYKAPFVEYPLREAFSKIISKLEINRSGAKIIWVSDDLIGIKVPGYEAPFFIPMPPTKVTMSGESPNVMYHYVGWLSGYFHSAYVLNDVVRQDTITEVGRIEGPWKNSEPKALARFLKSMEDIFELYPNIQDLQLRQIQSRLSKSMKGLAHGDLYSSILTLRSLLYLLQDKDEVAKIYFRKLSQDKLISAEHRAVASKNLGVLETE